MKKYAILSILILMAFSSHTTADTLTDEEKVVSAAQSIQSVVRVIPDVASHGSGFYIEPNLILTAEHVIHKPFEFLAIMNADKKLCEAKVKYRDEGLDLALLETNCKGKPLTFTKDVKLGETVLAMGHPKAFDFTISRGIVSNLSDGRIQFDAKVDYGTSGGLLLNKSGQILGVIVEKVTNNDGIAFAVPTRDIERFLERYNSIRSDK